MIPRSRLRCNYLPDPCLPRFTHHQVLLGDVPHTRHKPPRVFIAIFLLITLNSTQPWRLRCLSLVGCGAVCVPRVWCPRADTVRVTCLTTLLLKYHILYYYPARPRAHKVVARADVQLGRTPIHFSFHRRTHTVTVASGRGEASCHARPCAILAMGSSKYGRSSLYAHALKCNRALSPSQVPRGHPPRTCGSCLATRTSHIGHLAS